MKAIVYYYSYTGSNEFLAKKIAADLDCDIEEIKPRLNRHLLMLMGLNLGNTKLKKSVEEYDKIILCGPIWMGKLIVPLKNLVVKNINNIENMVFATCCGSTFEGKDKKFGHNLVFKELKKLTGEKCSHCEAFPIDLILTDEQKKDRDSAMKYRLNNESFKGEIVSIYDTFIQKIIKD
jgi:flavodoxin